VPRPQRSGPAAAAARRGRSAGRRARRWGGGWRGRRPRPGLVPAARRPPWPGRSTPTGCLWLGGSSPTSRANRTRRVRYLPASLHRPHNPSNRSPRPRPLGSALTFRLRDGCSASAWTAPDGSGLLTLDDPSVQTAPDESRPIVWMIIGMIKAHPREQKGRQVTLGWVSEVSDSGRPHHAYGQDAAPCPTAGLPTIRSWMGQGCGISVSFSTCRARPVVPRSRGWITLHSQVCRRAGVIYCVPPGGRP
jgi:hypothetical protein